jgi:hypothetical protein
LPGLEEQFATESLGFGDVEVEVPRLRPSQLRAVMQGARRVGQRLRNRSVDEVLAQIDCAVAKWVYPDSGLRRLAEQVLPPVTGFSVEMVRHGLPLLFASLRAEMVRGVLDAELLDRSVLDQMRKGCRAFGSSLITHVMSGNIPGLAAGPMLLSLAVKSPVLVKSAAGDPLFAALFAASIGDVDDELGRCLLVTHWRGGEQAVEEVAFCEADLVVASGSDAAIAAIAARVPGRFIGHGHKVSFAAIGRECLADGQATGALARRLAYDVSLWDQQGCLSPQLCYVESGGRLAALQFGELLAQELSRYALQLPSRRLALDDQARVLRFRQEAEWQAQGSVTLLASADSTDWSVAIEPDPDFVPTCLNRCVRVKALASLSDLPAVLAPHRRHLEATGLSAGAARLPQLVEMLGSCGVHRICPIGKMQEPLLSWRQGGRPRIAEWVEWVGAEELQG